MTKAKVIKTRHGQMIRLPKKFWVEGEFVYLKRTAQGFTVTESDPWEIFVEGCQKISAASLSTRTQPKLEKRSW